MFLVTKDDLLDRSLKMASKSAVYNTNKIKIKYIKDFKWFNHFIFCIKGLKPTKYFIVKIIINKYNIAIGMISISHQ